MKHKNIMVVGTSSGAGKSITVTGLCRAFFKDGYTVSPFKSQNMALNSYITKDGHEMGRAQALQAMACEIEAHYTMNPILLKPTGDRRIQVIVNGKSIGNMGGLEYGDYKSKLKKDIIQAYNTIKDENQICVIEGAGSPVELNIKQDDIVNMGLAEMVDAPVILVADIDRGGVFASIYGTISLMEPEERARVKGVIINKFRGNVDILKPGLEKIEELTGVPILGVMPYFELDIEDEDGVTEKFNKIKSKTADITVSVIKLKHISNFTDIDALLANKDVNVNYLTSFHELGNEDLIIIPGSKNTIDDLKDIKEKGIAQEIIKISRKGTPIIGICGGFQILGEKVLDPYGIEGDIKELPGLGLLDIETTMEKEKVTTQYTGLLKGETGLLKGLGDIQVKGYEIHQGVTEGKEKSITLDNRLVATVKDNIFGTYLHGIFDNREFTDFILNNIREKKGLEKKNSTMTFDEYRLQELDKLEKIFRENVDMEAIYKILEEN
ncbi:MAG: cobyric acid synthase [Cetobacterium sp.]|uniref:cobyric acid synthase n=1 Tax=Cetobacterium sp. TaxID=2071632 RepID=UPI0025C509B2|nr:cobyric acid synthase [Cetobacterium sp.]